jgi:hypothetical protein
MMMLKKAEPTHADIMAAKTIGEHHPYWAETIRTPPYANGGLEHTEEAHDYRNLLEILMCRELTELMVRHEAVCERAAFGTEAA